MDSSSRDPKSLAVICPALSGHLNPLLSLGRTLTSRGYRITVISLLDAEEQTRAAGLDFLPVGIKDFPLGSIRERSIEMSLLDSPSKILEFTIEQFKTAALVLLEEARDAVVASRASGLIVDQSSSSGGSIAEGLGLPFVSVATGLPLNREPDIPAVYVPWPYDDSPAGRERNAMGYAMVDQTMKPVLALVNERRELWDLFPISEYGDLFSPFAQISQMPAEFDFPRKQLPSTFHYTGPIFDVGRGDAVPFPYERLDGRPLVYVSLGTILGSLDEIQEAIAMACSSLHCQTVISLGNRHQESVPQYGDAIVVPYAPQPELLRRASLVITTGGLNTTLESLSNGVPLVVIPMSGDQPGIAARIAHHGVGQIVESYLPEGAPAGGRRVEHAMVQAAAAEVLGEARYREAGGRMRRAIEASGGHEKAADIVEQAVTARETVSS